MINHISIPTLLFILDFVLRLWYCSRILQRRLPSGVTWAWLSIIFFLPIFGTILYLYLGEYRLGKRRLKRLETTASTIKILLQKLFAKNSNEKLLEEPSRSFALTVRGLFDAPLLSGNDIELLHNAESAFASMIQDIDQAMISCDMVFYIWNDGGLADIFGEALIRAVKRGVKCRVLLDQIGSADFLNGANAKKLKNAGIIIQSAMPSGLIRSFFARPDLRIHRKILIIDGGIGYTGSLNLADPLYFKQNEDVGFWIDAFCRTKGPAVEAMNFIFLSDWSVETKSDFLALEKESIFSDKSQKKNTQIQCLPSGPALKYSNIEEVLIMAIYSARYRLVVTTPYFIPSESVLYALMTAAKRGVKVILITPEKVDSILTQYASCSYLKELVIAGVQVALFKDGMLHTKSVVVDGEYSLFGTLNLDPRSLRINFEITLAIYDKAFSTELNELQMKYMHQSRIVELKDYETRNRFNEFKEDLARLVGPLL
jgi:cardiolipin synthase